jgi:hypothetical protein
MTEDPSHEPFKAGRWRPPPQSSVGREPSATPSLNYRDSGTSSWSQLNLLLSTNWVFSPQHWDFSLSSFHCMPACPILPLDGQIAHSHQECSLSLTPGGLTRAPWDISTTSSPQQKSRIQEEEAHMWNTSVRDPPAILATCFRNTRAPSTSHCQIHNQTHPRSQLAERPSPLLGFPIIILDKLAIPIKRSLSAFPSVDPLPEPLRDLAVPIAEEAEVTEPSYTGRLLYSKWRPHSWPIQCRHNFSSSRILMIGKPVAHL